MAVAGRAVSLGVLLERQPRRHPDRYAPPVRCPAAGQDRRPFRPRSSWPRATPLSESLLWAQECFFERHLPLGPSKVRFQRWAFGLSLRVLQPARPLVCLLVRVSSPSLERVLLRSSRIS